MLSNSGGALSLTGNERPETGQVDAKWYAAYTMSRHEKRIAEQCERVGITHFLPLYTVRKTWKNRVRVELQLPLFPNYIFACLSPGQHVRLLRMHGVLRMVGTTKGLIPISPADMESLRQVDRHEAFVPHEYVHPGDMVRIHQGPLRGLRGVVLRKSNGLRFVISLDFIGKSVAVDLNVADLEPYCLQSLAASPGNRVPA